MMKKIKFFLIFVIGLLFGLLVHGLIEIVSIWVLLNWLEDFFYAVSWGTWVWVHLISMIALEIVGLIIAVWIFIRYEK